MLLECIVISPKMDDILKLRYFIIPTDRDIIFDVLVRTVSEIGSIESEDEIISETAYTEIEINSIVTKFSLSKYKELIIVAIGSDTCDEYYLREAALYIKHVMQKYCKNCELNRYGLKESIKELNEKFIKKCNVVIFGNEHNGKTSIANAISENKITNVYLPSTSVTVSPSPSEYDKAISVDISENIPWFSIMGTFMVIYDLPGIERFRDMWRVYIEKSDLLVLVTRSTKHDIIKSKNLFNKYKKINNNIIIIATFQDEEDALNEFDISGYFGVPAYGTVANDEHYIEHLCSIIKTHIILTMNK